MEPSYTPTPQPYERKRRAERHQYDETTAADALSADAAAEDADYQGSHAAPITNAVKPVTIASSRPQAQPAQQDMSVQRQQLRSVVRSDEDQARSAYREPIRVARPSTAQINAQPEYGMRDHRPAQQRVGERSPIIVAGSDKPRAAQQPQANAHYVPPVQRTASQLPKQSAAPVQRVQQTPRVLAQSAAAEGIARSASNDHMLQTTGKPIRSHAVPRWIIASIMIVFLLGLGCFTGRILMDAYLYKQQTAREEAFQKVVEAHPMQYVDLIQRYSMEYNLQPAFVASIILNESSYNTHAESRVGARGLMQLMPDTAQWIAHKLGLDSTFNVEQLWTAETNIRFGCWYLNYLSKQFGGDAVTVASAYHTGQGEVSSWLNNRTYAPDGRALSLSGMPEGPTKVYAGRVTRDYAIYDALYFKTFNP